MSGRSTQKMPIARRRSGRTPSVRISSISPSAMCADLVSIGASLSEAARGRRIPNITVWFWLPLSLILTCKGIGQMKEWGPLDFIGYIALGATALFLAINSGLALPGIRKNAPDELNNPRWGFLPMRVL